MYGPYVSEVSSSHNLDDTVLHSIRQKIREHMLSDYKCYIFINWYNTYSAADINELNYSLNSLF